MLLYAADAPTAADWLEAWGTLVGAFLSAGALIVALFVLRRDQKFRHEDKLDADAAQARLVISKVTRVFGGPDEGWLGFTFVIQNNSQSMITDVKLRLTTRDGVLVARDDDIPDLAAGTVHDDSLRFKPIPWPFVGKLPYPHGPITQLDLSITFIDAAGRRWVRTNQDEPHSTRIYVKFRVLPLIAEYVYLTPAISWINAKYRRSRFDLFQILGEQLRARAEKRNKREAAKRALKLKLSQAAEPKTSSSDVEAAASE